MSDLRTQPSNGAAAGDAGAIVAMFETYDRALAARDVLVSAGIDRSRIEILAQSGTAQDASFHYERNDEGIWGAIKRLFMPDEDTHVFAEGIRRGYAMLVVRAGAGDQEQIISLLESQDAVDVETHATNWRQSGWSGVHEGHTSWQNQRGSLTGGTTSASVTGASSGLSATGAAARGQEEVIPVYEEQLRVGKREVGRGSVRVRSYVVEQPVQEQVHLREERVHVERRPVDRPADVAAGAAEPFRERTIEVTATAEEAVVAKEARVKEEIVVSKDAEERTETVSDTVRRTEVEIDDRAAAPTRPRNLEHSLVSLPAERCRSSRFELRFRCGISGSGRRARPQYPPMPSPRVSMRQKAVLIAENAARQRSRERATP